MKNRRKKNRFFYPKSENDYEKIWRWQISKPLYDLLSIIIIILVLILVVKIKMYNNGTYSISNEYSYDSFFLHFVSGNVKIKAEAGYIAYEGEVKRGTVTGTGTLYGRDRNVIYSGEFKENEYSGKGKLYGEDGELLYEGEFLHNVFEGTGCEYGTGGTVKYEGMFSDGKRNGKGILYDDSSNPVYEGNFLKGSIVYKDFLGKTTEAAGDMYKGKRDIYYDDTYFAVDMKDIGAVYSGKISAAGIDDKVIVDKVFVKSVSGIIGGKEVSNIEEVKEIAGEPVYEGSVNMNTEEAVALPSLSDLKVNPVFDDAMEIEGYDSDKMLYIYSFQVEKLQYTFYGENPDGKFIMYSIEQLDAEGKGDNE